MISVALSPRIYVCAYHRWDKYSGTYIVGFVSMNTRVPFTSFFFCFSVRPHIHRTINSVFIVVFMRVVCFA